MKIKIVLFLLIGILITFCGNEFSIAQNEQTSSDTTHTVAAFDATEEEKEVTNINQIESFWQLTELGGIFRWFIFLTLIIGLGLVVYEMVKLVQDRINARPIISTDFKAKQYNELNRFFNQQKKSFIASIGITLTEIFEKTGSVQGFSEEVSSSVRQQEQQFNSFTTSINFLSDTAGALGLLGTVWGMFVTFFSETWDTTTILRGMGLALVTTLLGLIVSIILNFCSTGVFRFFNNSLARATSKADELRLALLAQKVGEYSAPGKPVYKQQYLLTPVTEKKSINRVNQQLEKPIRIKLVDANQKTPVPDKKVIFEIVRGEAVFEDGKKIYPTETDSKGEAEINFTVGQKVGEYIVNCFAEELTDSKVNFQIKAIAGPPTRLERISKELDSVPINKKLSSPIIVQLSDAFDNSVPDHPVIFTTTGGRFFKGEQQTVQVVTDSEGYASVDFIAGSKPEINNISAIAKGLDNEIAEFKIMSVEK